MKIKHDKRKVHSLTGRITEKVMLDAFKAVKRNRGAAGIDKVSVSMYEKNLEENLSALMRKLKSRTYTPPLLRRAYIPKTGCKLIMRPIGIPTVECRVAQEVVRRLINPTFEKRFHDQSYGFRPGRNCHQAILKVQEYMKDGYRFVLDADIKGFFDSIPHELIMQSIAARIADGNILTLIEKFLKCGVMEKDKPLPTNKGTPQGGVISPLLANAVLDHLDWYLDRKGYKFVRYADDFVILCKSQQNAKEALTEVTYLLENEMGLELSKEKTKITKTSEGFDFLGFTIHDRGARMREKSMEKFKTTVRQLTRRKQNLDAEVIRKLNLVMRGTVNYFNQPFTTVRSQFYRLDKWIRSRVRAMQRKRKWRTDNCRTKNKYLKRKGLISCWELCQLGERYPKLSP